MLQVMVMCLMDGCNTPLPALVDVEGVNGDAMGQFGGRNQNLSMILS
jgi:hypothetical protein